MKALRFISLLALCALALGGCLRDPLTYPAGPSLLVRVYIPDAVLSKAETGTHTALASERTVSSLQIWVFRAGATTSAGLIGYKELDPDALAATGLGNGSPARFSIAIDKALLDETPRTNVDVYAVVNGASAGFTIDKFTGAAGDWEKVTPAQLSAFVLEENLFGVNTLVTEVPAAGLPMAGVIKNEPMTGDFPVLSISTVELTRAVSKLRFVFCQMTEGGVPVDEFHITGISLQGQIGRYEKLFTDKVYSTHTYLTKLYDSEGYVGLNKSWSGPSLPSPANNPAPGDFLFTSGMDSQTYEDLIADGVNRGVLTEWGLTYFRETDTQLYGEISYTVGVGSSMRAKTTTFTMKDPGDFTRNHSWTVYCYFIGGRLVVQPTVLPWIAGHDRLTYKTEGATELKYEKPWLRYDLDKESWTWDDTWLVVAYGYEGGSVGRPTHSIMFTLETLNANDLRLQLNNDQFILVHMTESQDALGNPVYTYTKLSQSLTIPASPDKQITNFYVVPVSDNNLADPYVKVFITEMHEGDGLPPMNIPFNHNLPGDEDHTSILIYDPGRAEYNAKINNHKADSNVQADNYWLEEES